MVKPTSASAWHTSAATWCAPFVPNHGSKPYLSIARHALHFVTLTQECVHSFQHAFRHARGLSQPDRRPNHQDVASEHALAQLGPLVAVPFIGANAGFHVKIRDANDVAVSVIFA